MSFIELWEKVPGLSNAVKSQVSDALSQETKDCLEKYSPFEIGAFIRSAIDEIERGNIETVDALVRKQLY